MRTIGHANCSMLYTDSDNVRIFDRAISYPQSWRSVLDPYYYSKYLASNRSRCATATPHLP